MPWQPPASDADPNWQPPEAKGAGATLAKAEGISPLPTFDQPLSHNPVGRALLTLDPMGRIALALQNLGVDVPTPAPAQLNELLPAVTATAGGIIGGPPGAAVGGGAGEVLRQGIRQAVGQAPATGTTQRLFGLDPNSTLAKLLGIGAEAGGAGLTQGLGDLVAKAAPAVERGAMKVYSSTLSPDVAGQAKIAEKLAPVAGELPMGTRGMIYRSAGKKADAVGTELDRIYGQPIEGSYNPVVDALRSEQHSLVETPAQTVTEVVPTTRTSIVLGPDSKPITEEVMQETTRDIPETLTDPALHRTLGFRATTLADRQAARDAAGQPLTLADLRTARETADKLALRSKKSLFSPTSGPLSLETPRSQAYIAERNALGEQLHDLTGGPTGEGAKADAAYSAWKTLQSNISRGSNIPSGYSTNPVNWLTRLVSGNYPVLRTPVSRAMYNFAQAMKAGDHTAAAQALREIFNIPAADEDTSQTPPSLAP